MIKRVKCFYDTVNIAVILPSGRTFFSDKNITE